MEKLFEKFGEQLAYWCRKLLKGLINKDFDKIAISVNGCNFPRISVGWGRKVWAFSSPTSGQLFSDRVFCTNKEQLDQQGYRAQKGQILDASIIPVPKQRNPKEENEQIKAGEIPPDWLAHPNKLAQKDTDARWTKKNNVTHYGYKNHIGVDVKHKLIREYEVSDAALHDSQAIDNILDPTNTRADVYGDSAYRSAEQEQDFKDKGYRSKVNHKGKRNHPLSEFKKQVNKKLSPVSARVEHVFGHQTTAMTGKLMRCIGIVRAKATIGLRNLVYNMHRFSHLSAKR